MPLTYTISKLTETLSSIFEINTIAIKDDTGKLSARNEDDTAFIDIAGQNIELFDNVSGNKIVLVAPSLSGDVQFTFPDNDGDNGQVLQTNGSGVLSFTDLPAGSLASLSDTDVAGVQEGNFLIYSGGTWIDSTVAISALSDVDTSGAQDGDLLIFSSGTWADGTIGIDNLDNVTITTPQDNDILIYDTNAWINTPSSNISIQESVRTYSATITNATGSPLTLLTPPSNSVIRSIFVSVDTPAPTGGNAATIQVGTSVDTDAYLEVDDIDLTSNRLFSRFIFVSALGSPDPIIVTISNLDSKTFSITLYLEYMIPA